jgi:hypothetical protein
MSSSCRASRHSTNSRGEGVAADMGAHAAIGGIAAGGGTKWWLAARYIGTRQQPPTAINSSKADDLPVARQTLRS